MTSKAVTFFFVETRSFFELNAYQLNAHLEVAKTFLEKLFYISNLRTFSKDIIFYWLIFRNVSITKDKAFLIFVTVHKSLLCSEIKARYMSDLKKSIYFQTLFIYTQTNRS